MRYDRQAVPFHESFFSRVLVFAGKSSAIQTLQAQEKRSLGPDHPDVVATRASYLALLHDAEPRAAKGEVDLQYPQ